MTATRQDLTALAADLVGIDRSARRIAALQRAVTRSMRPSLTLDDLRAAPAWLRRPNDERRRLGRQAALLGIAGELNRSIDGVWLRGLAAIAGDAALDRARASGEGPIRLPHFTPAEFDAVAAGVLRGAVTKPLLDYAAPAHGARPVDGVVATALVALAGAP